MNGDFNVIRLIKEKGVGQLLIEWRILLNLISLLKLIFWLIFRCVVEDSRGIGGDCLSMSWLDCYLLSNAWVYLLSNFIQVALPCTIFGHFLILTNVKENNWGPKTTQILKRWAYLPCCKEFVKEQWLPFHVDEYGGYI